MSIINSYEINSKIFIFSLIIAISIHVMLIFILQLTPENNIHKKIEPKIILDLINNMEKNIQPTEPKTNHIRIPELNKVTLPDKPIKKIELLPKINNIKLESNIKNPEPLIKNDTMIEQLNIPRKPMQSELTQKISPPQK